MPRLRNSRAFRDGIILKSDTATPLRLYYDRDRFKGKGPMVFPTRFVPVEAGDAASVQLQEWIWANGAGGAGTTIETAASYAAGACEYGERVWLRQRGKATAAGALVEYTLPPITGGLTVAQFTAGQMFNGSLWITTLGRTVISVPSAAATTTLFEQDFGAGTQTEGITVFEGTGAACLYVGEFSTGIREFDGAAWQTGAAGTNRGWLENVYWTLGPNLATGGLASGSGSGAKNLIGTNNVGSGFYHVQGDPKVAGNWSSLTKVGNGGTIFPIQRTVASDTTVWFGTGLGVLGVDGLGYSPNLTKMLELMASVNNCAALAYWNGLIWVATESGLMVFAPNGQRIDLGQFVNFGARTGVTPIFGRPLALAPSPDGLYAGYYNALTQTSYIGCLMIDPDGTYRWSMAEAVIAGQIVTYLQQAIDSGGNPGLFIGTVAVSDSKMHLYRQYLPKYGDPETDILNSGPFQAATDWSLRLSRWNGGHPVQKALRRLAVEADYLGSTYPDNTIDVQVSTDGGTFTSQGTATKSARWSSPPISDNVQATNVQLKLSAHNTAAHPIMLHAVSVLYNPQPERTKFVTYPIIMTEEHPGQNPKVVLNRLERALREGPITITDHLGRTIQGMVESVDETTTEEAEGVGWVVHGDVTISTTRDVTRFDVGDTYDSGAPFS